MRAGEGGFHDVPFKCCLIRKSSMYRKNLLANFVHIIFNKNGFYFLWIVVRKRDYWNFAKNKSIRTNNSGNSLKQ